MDEEGLSFIHVFYSLFFLFYFLYKSETYNEYRNCQNDITDFVAVFRSQYIDIVGCLDICEPVYKIAEQRQYRVPDSRTERCVKPGTSLISCRPVRPEY